MVELQYLSGHSCDRMIEHAYVIGLCISCACNGEHVSIYSKDPNQCLVMRSCYFLALLFNHYCRQQNMLNRLNSNLDYHDASY